MVDVHVNRVRWDVVGAGSRGLWGTGSVGEAGAVRLLEICQVGVEWSAEAAGSGVAWGNGIKGVEGGAGMVGVHVARASNSLLIASTRRRVVLGCFG